MGCFSTEGKPSRSRVEAWRYTALLIGLATNFFGGTVCLDPIYMHMHGVNVFIISFSLPPQVYVFPNYTLDLMNDVHVDTGQVQSSQSLPPNFFVVASICDVSLCMRRR